MKSLAIAFTLLLITATISQAQTWGEVFRQKETQKKYLLEQVVALKLYAGYLKKGYDIASTGLQTVKDITKGEFSLHNDFIGSLKSVSPGIRNNAKVAEIIVFQLEISQTFNRMKNSDQLTESNLNYIQAVREKVIEECGKDLEELLLVITSGRMEMTDDERIQRLDKVYEAMKDKSAFTQSFRNEVNLLIRQREQETQSVNQLKNSYGIIN